MATKDQPVQQVPKGNEVPPVNKATLATKELRVLKAGKGHVAMLALKVKLDLLVEVDSLGLQVPEDPLVKMAAQA